MGRLPTGERQYEIEALWSVHHEVLRLILIGMKYVDIAKTLNISEAMVSYTANSTLGRRQLAIMQGARDVDALEVSRNIKKLAPKAVEVLENLMDNPSANIQLSAAKDILDRAGFPAQKELKISDDRGHFTRDEIAEIKQRAKSIGLCVVPGDSVIDAQAQEVKGDV